METQGLMVDIPINKRVANWRERVCKCEASILNNVHLAALNMHCFFDLAVLFFILN
jgi:hypothetical protein